MAKRFKLTGNKADRLATLRTKRDELAALVDKEPAGAKKERGKMKLAEIDRRLAKVEGKKFIPPFVFAAIFQLILAAIQWWLSSFWLSSPGPVLWL